MQAGIKTKPVLYILPGLAADERIYFRFKLYDYEYHYLNWVDPLPGEDISAFAKRFSERVDTSRPFVLIGCSLGGIMSMEMSRYIQPEKIILISSLQRASEFPWYLRFFKYFQIYRIIPFSVFTGSIALYRMFHGRSNAQIAKMLHDMIKESSPKFFKWAIHEVLHWKDRAPPTYVHGIHGAKDILFPARYLSARVMIPNGDHFMVVLFSESIEKEIRNILEK